MTPATFAAIGTGAGGFGSAASGFGQTLFGSSAPGSSVYDPQMDFYKDLWASGSGLMGQQMGNIGDTANALSGEGLGLYRDVIGGMLSNPFMTGLENIAANPMANVGRQSRVLGNLLSQFSGRQMGMAEQEGVSAGSGFGARSSVAKGLIGEEATRAYNEGVSGFINQGYNRSLQAGQAGAGITAQTGGLIGNMLPQMFQMGMNPFMAEWLPMQQMQGLLGTPITLQNAGGNADGLLGGIF